MSNACENINDCPVKSDKCLGKGKIIPNCHTTVPTSWVCCGGIKLSIDSKCRICGGCYD